MFKKMKFYKNLLIEMIETMCTLCLFMVTESRKYGCNSMYTSAFQSHFDELSKFSTKLRVGKSKAKLEDK